MKKAWIILVLMVCTSANLIAQYPDTDSIIRFYFEGTINGFPAIGEDGTVCLGSTDNNLYAFYPDGTERWRYTAGKDVYAPAIGSDGTIYFASSDATFYALNSNGTLKWMYIDNNGFMGTPAIDANGNIYTACGDVLHVLTPNGDLKWTFQPDVESNLYFVIGSDGTVYLSTSNGSLYAITENGSLKWKCSGCTEGCLAIDQNGVLYFTASGCLNAVNPDGTTKWKYHGPRSFGISYPVVDSHGIIYAGSTTHFYAFNSDGDILWQYPLGDENLWDSTIYSALGSDGSLYVMGSQSTRLISLTKDGSLKWEFNGLGMYKQSALMINEEGRIFFDKGLMLHELISMKVESPGLAPGFWPKAGLNNQNTNSLHSLNSPKAVIEPDTIVIENDNAVLLDATSSFDPNDDVLSYSWKCISRPDFSYISIFDREASQTQVVFSDTGYYSFSLTVTDKADGTSVDFITIHVKNIQIKSALDVFDQSSIQIYTPQMTYGDIKWIDFDADGDLDLSIAGGVNWQRDLYLLENDNSQFYKVVFSTYLGGQDNCHWIDFDKDGKMDLTNIDQYNEKLVIYINDGNKGFYENSIPIEFQYIYSSEWVDIDNDGDLDLFINGQIDLKQTIQILQNEDNTGFTPGYNFLKDRAASFDWGDYNNDGYQDLILSLESKSNELYTNNGDGSFTQTHLDFLDSEELNLKWFDADEDGYIDIVVSGMGTSGDTPLKIYKSNSGENEFEDLYESIANVAPYDIHFADYNNDGKEDIIVCGLTTNSEFLTKIFYNEGHGNFMDSGVILPEVYMGGLDLGDYDGDDDLDLAILSGTNGIVESYVRIFKNDLYSSAVKRENEIETASKEFRLLDNFPNPFNLSTQINYILPGKTDVQITLVDLLGREVMTIVRKDQNAGCHSFVWNGKNQLGQIVPSGLYLYQIKTAGFVECKKMLLLK